jgi:hypothetical protein
MIIVGPEYNRDAEKNGSKEFHQSSKPAPSILSSYVISLEVRPHQWIEGHEKRLKTEFHSDRMCGY